MNILITGANGFIGKNLVAELSSSRPDYTLLRYDMETDPALLDDFCSEANFVFHLAGVNRPKEQSDIPAEIFIIDSYTRKLKFNS
jgi:UDP-2-acetamido-2,6-beta-L-arabino-hexul-4-ose reductase